MSEFSNAAIQRRNRINAALKAHGYQTMNLVCPDQRFPKDALLLQINISPRKRTTVCNQMLKDIGYEWEVWRITKKVWFIERAELIRKVLVVAIK